MTLVIVARPERGTSDIIEAVNIVGVDPRDIRWEVDEPAYRVYFWTRSPVPDDETPERVGWACDETEITGADVAEVLAWAESEAPRRGQFTLYARIFKDGEPGLIHLVGSDPTS